MKATRTLALAAFVTLAGCAHAPAPAAKPAAAPTELEAQLKSCHALIDAKKLDEAQRCLEPLVAGSNDRSALYASYDLATVLLYRADFKGTAALFAKMLERERTIGHFDAQAMGYNAITWVHWAARDLDRAIAANERVKEVIEAAKVSDEDRLSVLKHYWWDRAYLYLDDADRKTGEARAAANKRADEARKTFEQITKEPGDHDGLAVLAAYFAYRRHDPKTAHEAAKTVDPAKDSDLQDLYVLWLAFDLAGDRAAADDIKTRIEKGYEYPMKVVILRELQAAKK